VGVQSDIPLVVSVFARGVWVLLVPLITGACGDGSGSARDASTEGGDAAEAGLDVDAATSDAATSDAATKDAAPVDGGRSVCTGGSEAYFGLRFDPPPSRAPRDLDGIATASVAGDRITLTFDDGSVRSGSAPGLAGHVPAGRWRTQVHQNTFTFTPGSSVVFRTLDGALRFAAWDLATGPLPDLAPLSMSYTVDDCATPTMCGDVATLSMTVTTTVGAVVVPNSSARDVLGWRLVNGSSTTPLPNAPCTDQSPFYRGYVTRL